MHLRDGHVREVQNLHSLYLSQRPPQHGPGYGPAQPDPAGQPGFSPPMVSAQPLSSHAEPSLSRAASSRHGPGSGPARPPPTGQPTFKPPMVAAQPPPPHAESSSSGAALSRHAPESGPARPHPIGQPAFNPPMVLAKTHPPHAESSSSVAPSSSVGASVVAPGGDSVSSNSDYPRHLHQRHRAPNTTSDFQMEDPPESSCAWAETQLQRYHESADHEPLKVAIRAFAAAADFHEQLDYYGRYYEVTQNLLHLHCREKDCPDSHHALLRCKKGLRRLELEKHYEQAHPTKFLYLCYFEACADRGTHGFSSKDKLEAHLKQVNKSPQKTTKTKATSS